MGKELEGGKGSGGRERWEGTWRKGTGGRKLEEGNCGKGTRGKGIGARELEEGNGTVGRQLGEENWKKETEGSELGGREPNAMRSCTFVCLLGYESCEAFCLCQ